MKRIGVTGGIGSGKTTFCRIWEDMGAYVLYADDFAKELMVSDEPLVNSIKEAFGEQSYYPDGGLNREYLAEEAFKNDRVQELNSIVHPQLRKRVWELALRKEKEGIDVFVYEAAILLNEGRPKELDLVILLTADEDARVSRAAERDTVKKEQVMDRLRKQPDFEKLAYLCDHIIVNDGDLNELKNKAQSLYKQILESS